jgi:amidase
MERRDFLKAGLAAGVGAMMPKILAQDRPASFELDEATTWHLQGWMRSGQETSESITRKYLRRIEEIDRGGPTLSSVIEVNPDALEIAIERDRERAAGRERSRLHGVPVLLKDNIETGDRMLTTAGSLALLDNRAARDAFIVARLREAGAVILGKTNLSEWANFRSTRSTSGWSSRGGQTRNPYALDRNPCGSSSGSGVAAAANLAALTVGTETDGSIVCPSTSNGIVGIKPTLGLLSRSGIIPLAHSQDTAGPMCRTVADAAIMLGIMAGQDLADPGAKVWKGGNDYTKFLKKDGLKGARIGVARQFFGFNDRVDAVMETAIRALKELGAVIVDPVELSSHGKYYDTEYEVLLYEFKAGLNGYLGSRELKMKSLADLIRFNEANRDRVMPYFGQEILQMAQEKGPLSEKKYREALATNHRLSRAEGIDAALKKHQLDALIGPTGGPAWTTDLINGDHFSGGSSTPSAVSGYPAITVPAGLVRGLPVGITFFGGAWSEGKLIKYAYAFEQETRVRKKPTYAPTALPRP